VVSDGPDQVKMDQSVIEALLEAFAESEWLEMTVTIGDDRLRVARPGAAGEITFAPEPQVAPAPPAPTPSVATEVAGEPEPVPAPVERATAPIQAEQMHASAQPLTGTVVESPSVGLFWRSPSPGAPPFVDVGTRVSAGDTLAIVEVMKLMNQLVSPVPGVVKAILAENGATVQYGQPLVVLDAEG
jgi:acetyl-CoA carboxylase biotin carboxyl carrier protein